MNLRAHRVCPEAPHRGGEMLACQGCTPHNTHLFLDASLPDTPFAKVTSSPDAKLRDKLCVLHLRRDTIKLCVSLCSPCLMPNSRDGVLKHIGRKTKRLPGTIRQAFVISKSLITPSFLHINRLGGEGEVQSGGVERGEDVHVHGGGDLENVALFLYIINEGNAEGEVAEVGEG